MPANFGFVMHTAQRKANESTIHNLGNGFTHRGFSGSWGTNKTKNWLAVFLGVQASYSQEFKHTVFGTF